MSERGFSAIGLFHPKNKLNIGSVLRAAGCYGSAFVAASGRRYSRANTDTLASFRHIPLIQVSDLFSVVPHSCVPVAVDLVDDAQDLVDFVHPERAFYVFGPEDGTLDKEVLSRCTRRVMVSTRHCMNLAAAVNVVLYDRHAKGRR